MNTTTEVRQHNTITSARYEYSETQLNIFFYLLSKLRTDNEEGIYHVSLKDLAEITGKSYNTGHIREATSTMGSRVFEIDFERSGNWKQLWMFDSVEYKDGVIEVMLTRSIRPYLFDLKENFTSFQLYSALRLSSKYAKRVYTICSQWKRNGQTKRYEIIELKTMLGLYDPKTHEETFTVINHFRQYVLDEAVKQINTHTDLRVRYEMKKEGRSFKYVTFFVEAQKQLSQQVVSIEPSRSEESKNELVDEVAKRIDKLSKDQISTAINALRSWGADEKTIRLFAEDHQRLGAVNKLSYRIQTKAEAPTNPIGKLRADLKI